MKFCSPCVFALVILVFLSGCFDPPEPLPDPDLPVDLAKWTVLVYMDSDNNLEPNAIFDMDKLESVGSTDKVNIIVQWDRHPDYDSSNGDWTGTKIFLVKMGAEEGIVESEELMDLGEVDMGNMDSLTDFVEWGTKNYPAEHYLIDVWNHGGGWGPHMQDETSGTEASVQELADALGEAGFSGENKLNLLVLNQCLMGQIDVVYAMQPHAKVMIASEEIIPGPGVDYAGSLAELVKEPNMSEVRLAEIIVEKYEEFYSEEIPNPFTTLTAFDLNKMDKVNETAEELIAILKENTLNYWPDIGRSIYFSEAFAKFGGMATIKSLSSYDFIDFAELVSQETGDPEISMAAYNLREALGEMIIAEYHGNEHPFANGLSVYFPEDEFLYNSSYASSSKFAVERGWDEFIRGYIEAEKTDEIAPSIVIESTSSKVANMESPLSVYGVATGNNIVTLFRVIGLVNNGKTFMLNTHNLTQVYTDYNGERKLPEFVDGVNNIDFTWAPVAEVFTNGQKQVIAPLSPAGGSDYYFASNGEYQSAGEPNPFDAVLVFDYRTGELVSATRLTTVGNETVASGFIPVVGDLFSPYIEFYDNVSGEFGLTKADSISFGENGLWVDLALLPENQYMIGFFIGDISGNYATQFTVVDVQNQPKANPEVSNSDIIGNWIGDGLGLDIFDDSTCISTVGMKPSPCVYWFRNNKGLPLVSFLIDNGTQEPVFMVFMVDASSKKIELTEMFEGGKYVLWKDGIKEEEPEKEQDSSLIGKWINSSGYLEFDEDGIYLWQVNSKNLAGTFSTSEGKLFMSYKGIETTYTYVISDDTLRITNSEDEEISFTKSTGIVQPPANPLVGSWYNSFVNDTAIFRSDGTYESHISGMLFAKGTYSINGSTLALNNSSATFFYTFSISGNTLTLFDNTYWTYASYVRVK